MKKRAKILISCLLLPLWTIPDLLRRLTSRNRPPPLVVLCYHDVPAQSRANFARQMEILKRWAVVVPADWTGDGGAALRCAITFDDALVSTLDNGIPEVTVRGFPCTIFVPMGVLGRAPDWAMEFPYQPNERVADAARVRALPSQLVTLASHSMSHPFLTRIPQDLACQEVTLSRSQLATLSGQPPHLFAFPYGDFDATVARLCKEAGYQFVFSVASNVIYPHEGRFVRGRITVDADDGPLEFLLKMRGAYRWVPLAGALKQLVRRAAPRAARQDGNPRGGG